MQRGLCCWKLAREVPLLISDPVESHQHRHVSSVSKLPTIEFEHYPEVSVIPETPDAINAPETSEVDELTSEEFEQLLAYADQCCPDDSEAAKTASHKIHLYYLFVANAHRREHQPS